MKILAENKDNEISRRAVRHSNCPPLARVKWLKDNGKITTEDPSKHIIDEVKDEEDKDLEEFKKMVSKNNNWYKVASYTSKFIDETKDPEILKQVLKDHYTTYSAIRAAQNPNCPPDVLKAIIDKYILTTHEDNRNIVYYHAIKNPSCPMESLTNVLFNEEYVVPLRYAVSNPNCTPDLMIKALRINRSELEINNAVLFNSKCPIDVFMAAFKMGGSRLSYIAANPNCPSEILTAILKRRTDNAASQYAAENPNCSSEALVEILNRKKNDSVSRNAANNRNCPIEARIQWLKDTGKIVKEDPSKHIIDEVKDEEDKDLEEFKKMVTASKDEEVMNLYGWLSTANFDAAKLREIWYNRIKPYPQFKDTIKAFLYQSEVPSDIILEVYKWLLPASLVYMWRF